MSSEQWLNPFDNNKPFDITLSNGVDYKDDVNKFINNKKSYIFVSYTEFSRIIEFIENKENSIILNKIKDNELKVVFIPDDSASINIDDFNSILEYQYFFNQENIKIIFSNFYKKLSSFDKHLYVGTFITFNLNYLILNGFDYSHLSNEKKYHFLSLNNKKRQSRILLFNFYESLNNIEKEMFLCSFNFKNKFLEKELFLNDNMLTHPLYYGKALVDYYKKCTFEIVTETENDVVTEKTYKPLLLGVPFIIYSIDNSYQINYFNNIGIDIDYFSLKNKNKTEIDKLIKEILSMSIFDIKIKYKQVFIDAEKNKIKIRNHLNNIKTEIKKFIGYEENG